jgi:hypothetical protein
MKWAYNYIMVVVPLNRFSIVFIYLYTCIAFYRSIVGEPVGYRISHSYNKCGMINSKSNFIDNENKEYKDCDIIDQVIKLIEQLHEILKLLVIEYINICKITLYSVQTPKNKITVVTKVSVINVKTQ